MALSLRRAPSSLTSPGISARRWEYQVFLSFRGTDTRMGFVSHLYERLYNRRGIRTFKDDRDLERGTTISPELLRAIEQSQFAIIVFSENYAFSSWCLDELTKIVQSMEAGKILPVFYKVEPTILRKLTGSFAQALMEHGTKFSQKKVGEWRAALKSVAGIAGWHVDGNKSESDLIDEVVNRVWEQVRHTSKLFNSPDKFVGRDFALKELMGLLALGENDVRFMGITGMGGIGKTTLARTVFDSISRDYDVRCFLANVREVSEREGTVVGLQKKLLSPILKEKVVEVWDDEDGANFIKNCLWNKKVLLVLDDVDHIDQLQKLAGSIDWFGNESRIIITTRNQEPLVKHDRTFLYKVEGMNDGEALALFCRKAFQKVQPDEEVLELSKHFVRYAKGLPLVLTVLGSLLSRTSRDAWDSVLANLQNYPDSNVLKSLKISYDGLEEEAKKIFLDIACFHKGKAKEQVIDILDRRFGNISSKSVIDTLIERSLLTMSNDFYDIRLEMHDLIQEMGRGIVDRESKEVPGNRTRIWRLNDLHSVLAANTGTEAIQAIIVNSPKLEEIRCDSNCFSNMRGLRHMELHNVKIKKLPSSIGNLVNLTVLNLRKSAIEELPSSIRKLVNLTVLNLSKSAIKKLPSSIGKLVNLTHLFIYGTTAIKELPSSIGKLVNLTHLSLTESAIEKLPSEIGNLVKLTFLGLSKSAIEELPPLIGKLVGLTRLDLDGTRFGKLPPSIGKLVGLNHLFLSESKIEELPSSIGKLVNLTWLNLSKSEIKKLPSSIGKLVGLTVLDLSDNKIKKLPSSIENLVGLTHLYLRDSAIEELPSSIGNLAGLTHLHLGGCRRLCVAGWPLNQALNRLRCLEVLVLSDCNLGEGAIPEDIGSRTSLKHLDLCGNHFVTLPASIQCLSELAYLKLDRCEMLQELPPLPSTSHGDLEVHVENCTALRRLTDPSNLTSNFANLYDFELFPLNCVRLVEDESFINYVRFKIFRWIKNGITHNEQGCFTYTASEIPEWFPLIKNEEAGDWQGIAFCFVWAREVPAGLMDVTIEWSSGLFHPLSSSYEHQEFFVPRHPGPEHVTMFYLPREKCRIECPEAAEAEFSVKAEYYDKASESWKVGGVNMVKWAARWVYKQDLVDLQQRVKVLKRTHEDYGEEAGPSGSAAIPDDEEPNRKRQKKDWAPLDIESE